MASLYSKYWIKKTSFIQVFDSIVQVYLLLFQNHETQCKYKPIQCQHYGCEEKYSADDIESHLRTCKYRPVKCNHCEETIPYFQQAVSVDCILIKFDYIFCILSEFNNIVPSFCCILSMFICILSKLYWVF